MHIDGFIFSALLILAAASIAVTLFRHLGLGSVLGLLVAGIAVGPYSPGPYVTTHVEDVRHFAELGVVLLLFVIGLEMNPRRLWSMRREVFGLGSLQIVVSGIVIALYFSAYQSSWQVALLIGMTFALSSTAFVMQLLQERGEIASKHGVTAFSILLMQDMAIVPLLAMVPILSDVGALSAEVPLWEQLLIVAGMFALVLGFGRYVVPLALNHMAKQGNQDGFLLIILMAVFLAAWAMHQAGVSMALGAFVMGMLLSGSRYRLQIQAHIEPYKGLLMSMFFVAVGMSIDLEALAAAPLLFAQHTFAIVAIKLTVLFVLALAFSIPRNLATKVAFYLAQGGEFGFVLFGSAKALQVIDDATFVLAIGVISVTMLATPPLVRLGNAIAARIERKRDDSGTRRYPESTVDEDEQLVILGGYGRVGHAVAAILHSSAVPFIAFDTDPAKVAQGRRDGMPVYYGSIGDLSVLSAAHVERASVVVITINSTEAALRAVSHVRARFPEVPIVCRAHDLQASSQLMEAGATHAYPEAVESSLRLGALTLKMLAVPQDNIESLLSGVRKDNYEMVRPADEDTQPP
ncbi:cation:proton antiporter [Pseudomonadota bacterium]